MRYRSDLERLATLDADTIVLACTERSVVADLVTRCLDESLELDELAEHADGAGDDDRAAYYRQEAAAWRATVTVLRAIGADPAGHGVRGNPGGDDRRRSRRGVA
ncbi:hypothetical protein GCM10009624_01870 [Gordonia sinesedis]